MLSAIGPVLTISGRPAMKIQSDVIYSGGANISITGHDISRYAVKCRTMQAVLGHFLTEEQSQLYLSKIL